jgi:ferredoxin/flavodoxin
MAHEIYYFSGTGNTYYAAREAGRQLKREVKPINIRTLQEDIKAVDSIGIFFPVYHQGLPNIIRDFVKMLENVEIKYIYALATYGDNITLALKYLDDQLKKQGKTLHAGFGIPMPYNYIKPTKIIGGLYDSFRLHIPDEDDRAVMFENCDQQIKKICQAIEKEEKIPYIKDSVIIESLVDFFHLRDSQQKKQWLKACGYKGELPETFPEAIKMMDAGFKVNSRCTGCGICTQVCPVDNIVYKKGKPEFLHHCEQCFACIHWCPSTAIQFRNYDDPEKHYHHPGVTLKEIMYEKS